MKDYIISWIIGIGMLLAGIIIIRWYWLDIATHVRQYKKEKHDGQLRWWWLDWGFIVWDVFLGGFRPSLIIALILLLCGIGIVVVQVRETVEMVMG
ncbi:hypothetical protein [Paenibacillus sp. OV219]|uniref:hypothetical protein n=1 Tax=Paenibacillus sp. OV219 TaxID=1884377 RepID=UPI0008D0A72F|nr:hypothetical protein [Paenibacillus sp. OV219]SEN80127.1 hypothetical protein SAMN05518847_104175 [Paenibacillus sp. OV219]